MSLRQLALFILQNEASQALYSFRKEQYPNRKQKMLGENGYELHETQS